MKKYLVAIDQSTSASKVFLIGEGARILRRFSKAHRQFYPTDGWAEHDTEEIWQNIKEGILQVTSGIEPSEIAALSLCNQRETTAFWDKNGCSLRPAIVWQDVRALELCGELSGKAARVKQLTGLDLSPYYPAAKAAHALQSDHKLRRMAARGEVRIGTIDSFLIYKLTEGEVFATDVSNASRTQLFDIYNMRFDGEMCALFGIDMACLAKVLPSDGCFGSVRGLEPLKDVPIIGVMGDSHASLFAQRCFSPGMTKTSYGTGSSVMMNTGTKPQSSGHGLSTSVAYGFQGETHYVLEGNITHSGDTLKWLCEQAEMVESVSEVEKTALRVPDSGGVYLVPAFSGMGAPHFDAEARGAFIGLNRATTRAHMVRAAMESMAYQNADVISAMQADAGMALSRLRADGGGCKNHTLMQLQADLLGCEVVTSEETELSALGSAIMAGAALGLWTCEEVNTATAHRYLPQITPAERQKRMDGWRCAVERVLNNH